MAPDRVGRELVETITKPDELLALHDVAEELFDILGAWFDVPERLELSLDDVDAGVTELGDPVRMAAMAMRELQRLRLLSTPGVRTTTDEIVASVQYLDRTLRRAPALRLQAVVGRADWDAALVDLVAGALPPPPSVAGGEDTDVPRVRELHGKLHAALRAVVRASDGEIRELV